MTTALPPPAAAAVPLDVGASNTSDAPASVLAGTVAAGMGLLVAPATGRFHAEVGCGFVGPGTVVAVVTGGGGRRAAVTVPVPAEICGLLALDGQLVQDGQALAWVRRLDG